QRGPERRRPARAHHVLRPQGPPHLARGGSRRRRRDRRPLALRARQARAPRAPRRGPGDALGATRAVPRTPFQALVFLAALWATLVLLQPLAVRATELDPELAALEARLHAAVNAVRERDGLVPLAREPALDAVARAHSRDMATRGYFAHETPEGLTPPDRLARGGITGITLAGENVGLTSRSDPAREIVTHWLASPVHRRNMLAPMFNATGIGVARAASGQLYFTQLFVTFPRRGDAAASSR